jgi:hypothetical protein
MTGLSESNHWEYAIGFPDRLIGVCLSDRGVDGIITDRPKCLLQITDNWNSKSEWVISPQITLMVKGEKDEHGIFY